METKLLRISSYRPGPFSLGSHWAGNLFWVSLPRSKVRRKSPNLALGSRALVPDLFNTRLFFREIRRKKQEETQHDPSNDKFGHTSFFRVLDS